MKQKTYIESRIKTLNDSRLSLGDLLAPYETEVIETSNLPWVSHHRCLIPDATTVSWGRLKDGHLRYLKAENPKDFGLDEVEIQWTEDIRGGVSLLRYDGQNPLNVYQVLREHYFNGSSPCVGYTYSWYFSLGTKLQCLVRGNEYFFSYEGKDTFWEFYDVQKNDKVREFLLREVLPYEV